MLAKERVRHMSRSEKEGSSAHVLREVPVLDAAGVRVRADEQGRLKVTLPDGSQRANVRVLPAFPITRPRRFLYLVGEDGEELGLLVDPKRLERESRDLILAQADQAYFMPRITRIVRVDERMGIARWEVETDRGRSSFDVVARSESVWYVGRNRIVIRDADGNRYLIEDLTALDRRSRGLADLYL
jgi:hypothetical protein